MTQPTISQYYQRDHEKLDRYFQDFRRLKRSDAVKAKEFFVKFRNGLLRHIAWEEDLLFPHFEAKTGMRDSGPTYVMRMEHQQIKSCLEAIHRKVAEGNPDSENEEEMLLGVLGMHNMKEENILYPAIDRTVTDGERRDIFHHMESVPVSPAPACCEA